MEATQTEKLISHLGLIECTPAQRERIVKINAVFDEFIQRVKESPVRSHDELEQDGTFTGKFETFLYAIASGPDLAIAVLNLLRTGLIFAQKEDLEYTFEEFNALVFSFYEEARAIYLAMYYKHEVIQEAFAYFRVNYLNKKDLKSHIKQII